MGAMMVFAKVKAVTFAIVVALVLAACGAGPNAVRDGVLRDTIFAIETKENGSHFVWMRYDDVGTYCTMDDALFSRVRDIFNSDNPEVYLTYSSLNVGSQEAPVLDILGIQGCKHSAATVYIITNVRQAD